MPRGGKRPNPGPKKGTKYAPTIAKEAARDALRQIVLREMDAMTAAQIAHAKGLNYLVARNKTTGKFEKVTEELLTKWQASPDDMPEIIEVWQKDPSIQAYTDLMNRAIDKPAEQLQEIKLTGEINIVSRLHAARKRLAEPQPGQ
jgi:hypothetical protein